MQYLSTWLPKIILLIDIHRVLRYYQHLNRSNLLGNFPIH